MYYLLSKLLDKCPSKRSNDVGNSRSGGIFNLYLQNNHHYSTIDSVFRGVLKVRNRISKRRFDSSMSRIQTVRLIELFVFMLIEYDSIQLNRQHQCVVEKKLIKFFYNSDQKFHETEVKLILKHTTVVESFRLKMNLQNFRTGVQWLWS